MLYSAFQEKTINKIKNDIIKPIKDKKNCGQKSDVIIVEEKYIDSAIEIANYFRITFEPSGISGLALFFQMIDNNQIDIQKNDKIIIINTGKSAVSKYY